MDNNNDVVSNCSTLLLTHARTNKQTKMQLWKLFDTLHEQISHFYFLLTQSDTVKGVSDSTLLVKNSYLNRKRLKTTTNSLPDFCNSDSCFLCVFSNLYTWLNHCVLFVPCDSLSGTVGFQTLYVAKPLSFSYHAIACPAQSVSKPLYVAKPRCPFCAMR